MNPRDAIERVLFAYCTGIDRGDFESTAALFGTDGLYGLVDAGAAKGSGQVLRMLQASVRLYDGVPRTRHVVTNVVIDVAHDEQTGRAQSYIHVLHAAPGDPLRSVVAGTYFDQLHVVDGAWQFAERRIHIELTGDLSTHLQPGFL